MKWLVEDTRRIYKDYFQKPIAMKPLTKEEKRRHYAATYCFICEEKFEQADGNRFSLTKVRDHDHFTGQYRGPAHSECNLKFWKPKFIPVFLHNMSNYDIHLFVREAAAQSEEASVIPQNKEKYISFFAKIKVEETGEQSDNSNPVSDKDQSSDESKNSMALRFLDSYRFMACSLETLASYLDVNPFIETEIIS